MGSIAVDKIGVRKSGSVRVKIRTDFETPLMQKDALAKMVSVIAGVSKIPRCRTTERDVRSDRISFFEVRPEELSDILLENVDECISMLEKVDRECGDCRTGLLYRCRVVVEKIRRILQPRLYQAKGCGKAGDHFSAIRIVSEAGSYTADKVEEELFTLISELGISEPSGEVDKATIGGGHTEQPLMPTATRSGSGQRK